MSRVRHTFLVGSVLAIAAITPATALGAAKRTEVPVRGTLDGVTSVDLATNPPQGTTQVSGQISHLGAVTGNSDFSLTFLGGPPAIPLDLTGTLSLVAANGDELFGTFTGSAVSGPGDTTGTNLLTIIGGTGRFTDATGSLTETYSAQTTAQSATAISGPIALTIEGRISY